MSEGLCVMCYDISAQASYTRINIYQNPLICVWGFIPRRLCYTKHLRRLRRSLTWVMARAFCDGGCRGVNVATVGGTGVLAAGEKASKSQEMVVPVFHWLKCFSFREKRKTQFISKHLSVSAMCRVRMHCKSTLKWTWRVLGKKYLG